MNQTGVVLAIDFGTAFVRVARASLVSSTGMVVPQVLEFGRAPRLRNAICLDQRDSGRPNIGDEIFSSEMSDQMAAHVYQWTPLDPQFGPGSELGRVLRLLLARVLEAAGLNEGARTDPAAWKTVYAARPGIAPQQADAEVELLGATGFPNPRARDSALAALAWHTRDSNQSGTYLVVDCGATETRFSLCQIESTGARKVLSTTRSQPGGRDFDRLLTEHVRTALNLPTSLSPIESLSLIHNAEQFKEGFSRDWSQGKSSHEAFCQIGDISGIVCLKVSEFDALTVTLQQSFMGAASAALNRASLTPQAVSGVVLAGGGALWPWVKTWAFSTFEPSRVRIDQYPEESIVRGLTLLRAGESGNSTSSSEVSGLALATGPNVNAPQTAVQERLPSRSLAPRRANPRTAFLLEMLGGMVGFLGLGWFFAVGNVGIGAVALASWWFVLIASFLTFGGVAIAEGNVLFILLWILLYLGIPFLSGWLASRRIRSGTADQNLVKRVENN